MTKNIICRHGRKRLQNMYFHMVRRCCNQCSPEFKRYGGRGIKVCADWLNEPDSFYKWAIESGYNCTMTIDRIDNDRDYEPSNCQFLLRSDNSSKGSKTQEEYLESVKPMVEREGIFEKFYGTVGPDIFDSHTSCLVDYPSGYDPQTGQKKNLEVLS